MLTFNTSWHQPSWRRWLLLAFFSGIQLTSQSATSKFDLITSHVWRVAVVGLLGTLASTSVIFQLVSEVDGRSVSLDMLQYNPPWLTRMSVHFRQQSSYMVSWLVRSCGYWRGLTPPPQTPAVLLLGAADSLVMLVDQPSNYNPLFRNRDYLYQCLLWHLILISF